jgi:cell division protein FtsI (penicillin-binding protein 3)
MRLLRRYIIASFLLALVVFAGCIHSSYDVLMGHSYNSLMKRMKKSGSPPIPRIFIERGPILDRNGRFLAKETRIANVYVWRPSIANLDALSQDIADILDMPPGEIRDKISSSERDFIYLKKQIDDTTVRSLTNILEEKKISGVAVESVAGRMYPEKKLASQIVGSTGVDNYGIEGIEYAFNDILNGTENNGKGSQVVLTIDANVQQILERIAGKTMSGTGAEAVMLIAMDPRTGDILGSASMPDFEPNNFRTADEKSRMNRPLVWAYEPGSVFTIFTIAAFMDSGTISDSSAFICNGAYTLPSGGAIACSGVHGRVSAREIIIHSCNAGAAFASERLGNAAFYEILRDFGFGYSTGAGSPGETAGFLLPVEHWSDRSKPALAIGHEIAVSAYQMIQAASAIANDGVLISPRIVSHIISPDGNVTEWKNAERRHVLKAETARAMRSYMTDAASGILAIKTGTAQIIDTTAGIYSDTDFIASCVAILPAESPSLILYLAIIKPKGEISGGRIAAPAIRETAEALIDYLGIPRRRDPQVSQIGQEESGD